VFSEAAIVDIGRIARWLEEADVRGALIRSGETSGFCAGANLSEIWAAYDMIPAAPKPRRFAMAYDHFFHLGLALRALETCSKPVASAIAGLLRKQPNNALMPSAHAVDREYRVLAALRGSAVPTPDPYRHCTDRDVRVTPFYLMEWLDGRVFHELSTPGLRRGERAEMFDSMCATLAEIHKLDFRVGSRRDRAWLRRL
jgi:hypothetical protein